MNAPPQGAAHSACGLNDYYAYMNDNAMVADRSIADLHFIGQSDELSGTGRARLARYGELLATRGGTIYYDTALADERLIERRTEAARRYLAQAVPGSAPIEVVAGCPLAHGMSAKEALMRRDDMLKMKSNYEPLSGGAGGTTGTSK